MWAQDPILAQNIQEQYDKEEDDARSEFTHAGGERGKIIYGYDLKVATLNMHSLRDTGKREELEIWAKDNDVDMVMIQETWTNMCAVERREHYTTFFSSDDDNETDRTEAGVAIMIANKHLNKVVDIEPTSDRLMAITLRGTVTYTFINTYMYTASNPEKNPKQYKQLTTMYHKYKKGGPVYIGGDFNADIQSTDRSSENKMVGGHTFDKGNEKTLTDTAMMANRDEMVEFCSKNKFMIVNTWFKKKEDEKATWRKPGTQPHHPRVRGYYAVKDYWLCQERWRNSCNDCASDGYHGINTDHFPLILSIRVTLSARKQTRKEPRKKYHECTTKQQDEYNKALNDKMEEEKAKGENLTMLEAQS